MKTIKKVLFLLTPALLAILLTPSCDKEEEPNHPCDTVAATYSGIVQPILAQNCYGCHANGNARGGVTLGTYAEVQVIAQDGRLSGSINHEAGYAAMPAGAAKLDSCDIYLIDKWIDEGALDN